jgi:hypothetical protein
LKWSVDGTLAKIFHAVFTTGTMSDCLIFKGMPISSEWEDSFVWVLPFPTSLLMESQLASEPFIRHLDADLPLVFTVYSHKRQLKVSYGSKKGSTCTERLWNHSFGMTSGVECDTSGYSRQMGDNRTGSCRLDPYQARAIVAAYTVVLLPLGADVDAKLEFQVIPPQKIHITGSPVAVNQAQ